MSNPHEYTIQNDREGFWIMDEYGEDVCPMRRFSSVKDAEAEIGRLIEEDAMAEAQERGDAWAGGFAENH